MKASTTGAVAKATKLSQKGRRAMSANRRLCPLLSGRAIACKEHQTPHEQAQKSKKTSMGLGTIRCGRRYKPVVLSAEDTMQMLEDVLLCEDLGGE